MSDDTPPLTSTSAAGVEGASEPPNANGTRRCVFCEVPLHAWDVYLACPTCLYYAKLE